MCIYTTTTAVLRLWATHYDHNVSLQSRRFCVSSQYRNFTSSQSRSFGIFLARKQRQQIITRDCAKLWRNQTATFAKLQQNEIESLQDGSKRTPSQKALFISNSSSGHLSARGLWREGLKIYFRHFWKQLHGEGIQSAVIHGKAIQEDRAHELKAWDPVFDSH